MPVLQLFEGISGQYLSPRVFLVESLSMPIQTMQLHPLSPGFSLGVPKGLGAIGSHFFLSLWALCLFLSLRDGILGSRSKPSLSFEHPEG